MRRRSLALIVAMALILTGCALPASRAGGAAGSVTVRLGTPDPDTRPSAAIVAAFDDEVQSRTAGEVRIEPQWQPIGAYPTDDSVARSLADGDVEFALVPTRAWDILGVDSLTPLQLPGLIVTDSAAAAVVSDPVAERMMAGLDEVGVTGLALVPEGVRRLFVFPSHTPESFDSRGSGIRTIASKASDELFDLVGATTSDASGVDLDAQILSGDVSAVETSWNLLNTLSMGVSSIGDVALFTKFDVIAVNSDWFAARSADERTAIRAAATAAAARVVDDIVPDADQAAAFCAAGRHHRARSTRDSSGFRRCPRDARAALAERTGRSRRHRPVGAARRGFSAAAGDPVLLRRNGHADPAEHRPGPDRIPGRRLPHECVG